MVVVVSLVDHIADVADRDVHRRCGGALCAARPPTTGAIAPCAHSTRPTAREDVEGLISMRVLLLFPVPSPVVKPPLTKFSFRWSRLWNVLLSLLVLLMLCRTPSWSS